MQEATVQNPASFTALPAEVIAQIFADLHKSELKYVRLVCQYFDKACLSLLFDKVIISDQAANFAPFRNITSTPRLNRHVKRLVYDLQWFDDLKEAYYILDLVKQLKEDVASRKVYTESTQSSRKLAETLVACNYFKDPGTTHDRERILLPWNKYVRMGYQEYQKQWHGQNSNTHTFPCLISALRMCPNVRCIEIRASWDFHHQTPGDQLESLLPCYSSSGFLARHWHPLYLRPKNLSQDPLERRLVMEDIFSVIERSGKEISQFSFGNGCTIGLEMHRGTQSMREHMPLVFQNLTSLSLDIAVDLPPSSLYITGYLSPALRAAQGLKHLTLRASNYSVWQHKNDMRWWIYHAFSDCVYPKLESLRLTRMAASAEEFLRIIRNQPLLQSLHLESTNLLERPEATHENWRYFFACLRQLSLKEFSVGWPLTTSDYDSKAWNSAPYIGWKHQWAKTKELIEQYVLHSADISLPIDQEGNLLIFDEKDPRLS
ncbi:MAG: hypothetical protein Q9225_004337 [Loekoesia sp. 1 TL-2023]